MAGGRRRQAYPRREAADARPAERGGGGRRGAARPASCWRSASTGASIRRWSRSASASPDGRLGQVMSMVGAAHHQHRPVHPGRQLARRSPTRRRAAPSPRSACIRIDHMIEFGGRVRDVLCTTGRYIAGPVRRHHQHHAALRERRDRAAVLLGRDRDRRSASRCYGTKGLAEISKPNLQRFRFVPISTVAPTGPVTAPPDEIVEHAGLRHAQRRDDRIRPLHRGQAALSGRRSTRCCTACRCSTPWSGQRAPTEIEHVN